MLRLFVLVAISASAFAQPSINSGGIVNVSGEQPLLAPNAVFAVYGQNLGPSSIVVASAPSYPASLGGTSITFTPISGGPAITPKLVYSESIAVAGVLPSSITPGTYAVRVAYQNQTSAPHEFDGGTVRPGGGVQGGICSRRTGQSSGSGNRRLGIATGMWPVAAARW
jgi:hypothetical protein